MLLLRKLPFAVIAVLGGGLSGCVTLTPYGPSDRDGFGYSETRLEDGRTRIIFNGDLLSNRESVENHLLYRAAERTVQDGFDYFVLISHDVEIIESGQAFAHASHAGLWLHAPWPYCYRHVSCLVGHQGGWGWYDREYPQPWRLWYKDLYAGRRTYRAIAEIVMYRGEVSENRDRVYQARQLLENLAGRIRLLP